MTDQPSDLRRLYEKIDALEIAMMTTRRPDGHLVSRAMATQKPAPGADLWFVTSNETHKLDEVEHDPHVNLTYYKDSSREWISVSGTARVVTDRPTIHRLYQPDWSVWFAKGGDPRYGTPDDPRIVLIAVDVASAVYLEQNKPKPIVLFEIVKNWLAGTTPELGEMHRIEDAARRQ
jgi:general stress protein 26